MMGLADFLIMAAIASLGLSIATSVWDLVSSKTARVETVAGEEDAPVTGNQAAGYLSLSLTVLGGLLITVLIINRAVITGHAPFSNMYEFAVAFSWGIVVMGLFFWWRYHATLITIIGLIIAIGLLIFASRLPSQAVPLMPALQQSLLLTTHVASAVIAYGAFTVGFAAAVLYLIQSRNPSTWAPSPDTLDEISYNTVIVAFPFMTLLIILGALWADVAWGKYWSWDPKETASLVTWLLYASYLHARVMRGWRGKRTAILLIIGFCAVIITFFGNYIFNGLHSYV
jgi:cytochrome c-type biogenesis protein CcsB